MKRILPILILTALLAAGCQSPSASDTDVQTRVAAILTDIPTYTAMPPTVTATVRLPTVALPTPTEEPTENSHRGAGARDSHQHTRAGSHVHPGTPHQHPAAFAHLTGG